MLTKENFPQVLQSLGFKTENDTYYSKEYGKNTDATFTLSVDFANETFGYPEEIEKNRLTTLDFHQKESFVVFECIVRLFDVGYKPCNIVLEGKNYEGHDLGWIDILVRDNDGTEYMIIECKTASEKEGRESEFEKHWKRTLKDGDQLFRYFNTFSKAHYLCLYTSDFVDDRLTDIYHVITLKDNDEYLKTNKNLKSYASLRENQGSRDEFFEVWRDTYLQDYSTNGVFESDSKPFDIGQKKLKASDLKEIDSVSMQKKYNEFATILRKHNVSSKENAFDKLVNLFLAKIVDETGNPNELKCLWRGAAYDNYFDMQDRLFSLYVQGMKDFFKDEVTYVKNEQIESAFKFLKNASEEDVAKTAIFEYFRQLKYFNNNPFAFLDVHNEELFYKNAVILKEMVNMVQDIKIKTNEQNQFLGDLFEGFLDQGIKQSEGQFFTPLPIVKFLISSLPLENLIATSSDIPRVIDYACGAGHFLTEYANQIKPLVQKCGKANLSDYYKAIYGIEKEYRLSKVSQVSAFMYGQDGINILYKDALAKTAEIKEGTFSLLVANPPYSVKGFLETLDEEGDRKRYELYSDDLNISTNNSIETFFVERAKQLLASNGMAAIILPSSVLSNGNIYTKCREIILRFFEIVAIAEFGSGTFGKTGTNTATLFLRRREYTPSLSEQCKTRVNAWFSGNFDYDGVYTDSDLFAKYCEHTGIDSGEYKAWLQGGNEPKQEIFAEYRKEAQKSSEYKSIQKRKIKKGESEAEFREKQKNDLEKCVQNFMKGIEKDKLFFFMLASQNGGNVIVVKSPDDNKAMKQFLGYEWSASKGNEGIKYLGAGSEDGENLSKNERINGIRTPLFNPKNLDDNAKLNTLIRNNFLGRTPTIPESLAPYARVCRLCDMLDFSRVTFDKAIRTSGEKKTFELKSKYELMELQDVCSMKITDGTHKTPTYCDASMGIPFISSKDVVNERIEWDSNDIKYIIPELHEQLYKRLAPQKDDVLLSKNGTIGYAALVEDDKVFDIYVTLALLRPNKKVILPKYLLYIANSEICRKQYDLAISKGMGVPNLHLENIQTVKIPLPPLDIQKQIVAECEAVDAASQKAQDTVAECKKQIAEVMADVRGNEISLGDIGKICMCKRIMKHETNTESGIPFFKIGTFGGKADAYISVELFEKYKSAYSYPKAGQILISAAGTLGKTVVFDGKPAYFQDSNIVWIDNDETVALNQYIFYAMKIVDWKKYATEGSVIPRIYNEKLRSVTIPVPPLDEQKRIVREVAELEERIAVAKRAIAECKTKKAAVLEKWL